MQLIKDDMCTSNFLKKRGVSGIWTRSLEEITSVDFQHEFQMTPFLGQNYPNPFNPATLINYSVPRSEFVVTKIYDILGKEIRTLVSEEKQPGYYEIKFNGSGLSSGIYFYRMQAGNFIALKKLILLK